MTQPIDFLQTIRPHQEEIRKYRQGLMGISAVPGSGKTFTLSLLASDILADGLIGMNQEILVVTLVNAAVDNFYMRINAFIQARGLMPNLGYRVRTLHGLAHDIVRERPDLAGLDNRFQIIDEREALTTLKDCVIAWQRTHPEGLEEYITDGLSEYQLEKVRKNAFPELLESIAANFIRYAKDLQLAPYQLTERSDQLQVPLPLAQFGAGIYECYQRALAYRGAVDFDDLTRLAIQILHNDPLLLERLRNRWPYILEDEAQDSSRLQETLLSLLSRADQDPPGNWVRVGDPNQAVYETFTTANPRYLMAFIERPGVQKKTLPTSSRSSRNIIGLANQLVNWCKADHPTPGAKTALSAPPWLLPVSADDAFQNPQDKPNSIYISKSKFSPQEEINAVADSLEKWLPDHPGQTVAVLAPRNIRAFAMVDELRKRNIECVDNLLRSTSSTRFAAGAITHVLRYLVDPQSPSRLAMAYRIWRRDDREDEQKATQVEQVVEALRKCARVEEFLYPEVHKDWLADNPFEPELHDELEAFRSVVRRWVTAVLLPIDQLILTLSQDFLTQPTDLAIAHKLAALLRQASQDHPDWRMGELAEELAIIARNERRFIGFSGDDSGFDPGRYPGKVVVATMHKAKGLEWDRVYIMSANNYDFPSGQEHDTYISEKWFTRDSLNLEAEALKQLEILAGKSVGEGFNADQEWYQEGFATHAARLDYVRERLRLLYVGITRARQELIITWNSGRQGKSVAAYPIAYLAGLDPNAVADMPLPDFDEQNEHDGN